VSYQIPKGREREFVELISENLRNEGKPEIPLDVQQEMIEAFTTRGTAAGAAPLNAWAKAALN